MPDKNPYGLFFARVNPDVIGLITMTGLSVGELIRFLQRSIQRNPEVEHLPINIGDAPLVAIRIDPLHNTVSISDSL